MKNKHFIIMSILMGTLAVFSCLAQEEKALLGQWTFNEGTGEIVADSSGNGNNGKIANAMRGVAWVEGRNGKALQFTGGDPKERNQAGCVIIPNLTNKYDFSKAITIEAWIKLTNIQRESTYEIVSNTESDRGKGFRLRISWGSLAFGSGEGGEGKTWGAGSSPSKVRIEVDTWYHVAGVFDGSLFRVYLDGNEVGVSPESHPLTKGQNNVYIGAYCGGYAYGFNGVIDDVKIYDCTLTPEQILKHAKLNN